MESLVTTLETSKKLKAAGFPQNTHFTRFSSEPHFWKKEPHVVPTTSEEVQGWFKPSHYSDGQLPKINFDGNGDFRTAANYIYAAPTAQEIMADISERFPQYRGFVVVGNLVSHDYRAAIAPNGTAMYGPTMAEALAELWLKLQEGK